MAAELSVRGAIRRYADFPRYLWERSGARSVRPRRRFSPSPQALARIGEWVRSRGEPAISICIPSTDRLDLLVPCLESLAATCTEDPVEVIIGDTESCEETREVYSRLGLPTVSLSRPFNFSVACNAMAAVVKGERLLFLNSDTHAESNDWVRRLVDSSVDEVIGAALVYPGTRRLQHAGVEAVRLDGAIRPNAYPPHGHRSSTLGVQNIGIGRRLDKLTSQRVNVMAVTGAFLCTSHALFDSLQGFDELYRSDLQDFDYCLRARARGIPVICRRDIVFSHRHAASRGRYEFPAEDWQLFLERWSGELERQLASSPNGTRVTRRRD